jgi:hypothetical protein
VSPAADSDGGGELGCGCSLTRGPNCQTHLDVDAFIPVPATSPTAVATAEAFVDPAAYGVEIRTHHRVIPASPSAPPGVAALDITEEQEPLFRFEVR